MNDLLETTELPRVGDRVTDGNRSGKLEKIINLKQGQKLAQVAWDNGNCSDVRLSRLEKSPDRPPAFGPALAPEASSLAAFEGADQESSSYAELATQINALNTQGLEAEATAVAAGRAALELRKELGDRLVQAKATIESELGYGQWGKWLLANCPTIQPRMASTYMRLSREWEQIQGQAGEEPLTLRGAIAILQGKPLLTAEPEKPAEPELTFEQVQESFAPWGDFAPTGDPKFKYSFDILGKSYHFRGLREAMRWHEENCYDWNTLEARAKQQAELSQDRTCVACQHRQLIGDGSEFRCESRGSTHGVRENLGPDCRHYKPYLMAVAGRGQVPGDTVSSIPATPCGQSEAIAQPTSETVSEVEAELDAFAESMAPSRPHPGGVLASSARSGKAGEDLSKDERYTPEYVWMAALRVTGAEIFDLDPATNDQQDPHVPCLRRYTILDNGLVQDWSCETLWSNFPYSKIDQFVSKYLATWESDRFTHGFTLTKGDFSTKWCQKLLSTCTAVCLINHRLAFIAPEGELDSSFFASLLFYHGPNLAEFTEEFSEIGSVMVMAGACQVPSVDGRAGLPVLAESIALQEQRYAELVEEHLKVGDRILLHASPGQANWQYEVIEFEGETVRAIGPFADGLKSSPLTVKVGISQVRRIVSGGAA